MCLCLILFTYEKISFIYLFTFVWQYDRQSEKEKSKDQMDILNSQLKQKWDVLRFKAASDREKKQDMILPVSCASTVMSTP